MSERMTNRFSLMDNEVVSFSPERESFCLETHYIGLPISPKALGENGPIHNTLCC